MRTIYAFVVGAIAGGLVVLFWEQEISEYVGDFRGARHCERSAGGGSRRRVSVRSSAQGKTWYAPPPEREGHELVPFWFLIRAPL